MKSRSQNSEDQFVLGQFDAPGVLLEIGANDGITFSNSKLLIELGWEAYLIEPGSICGELYLLHKSNPKVHVYSYGIGEREEKVKFWESGAHVKGGVDTGLVSTTNFEETKRWPDVEFREREIQLVPWNKWYKSIDQPKFDFISIDTEGNDLLILEQIDLEKVGCRCLCVEWNSKHELLEKFVDYCVGYKLAHFNAENLIFCK